MSKSIRTTTQFKERDCVIDALIDHMGLTRDQIEIHENAVDVYDYTGRVVGRGNVVVRRQNAKSWNDLAFTFNAETKSFDIIRDVDGGYNKVAQDDTWLGRLTAKYAEKRVLKQTKAMGFYNRVQPVRKNGKLILEVVR